MPGFVFLRSVFTCGVFIDVGMQLLGVSPAGETIAAAEDDCDIGAASVSVYSGEAASGIVFRAGLAAQEIAYITEDRVCGPERPLFLFAVQAPDGLGLGSPAFSYLRE